MPYSMVEQDIAGRLRVVSRNHDQRNRYYYGFGGATVWGQARLPAGNT